MSTAFLITSCNVPDIPVPSDSVSKKLTGAKDRYVLLSLFQQQDRDIDRVLRDGNCLFRALSLQATGNQDFHPELRKILTPFEERNKAVLSIYHINLFVDYSKLCQKYETKFYLGHHS